MMEIVSEAEDIVVVEHHLIYDLVDSPGSGFAFPCNKHGKLLPGRSDAAKEHYHLAKYDDRYEFKGVREWTHTSRQPAVGRCDCGEKVSLDGFTNPCVCGREYDMGGHILTPRYMWGEETGEHPADISRIP